ncbi:arylamine N-acetyltransferase-like [Dermacentor andersoni]|uniref:arylamine N-acetyltransferase-like n=1 Tax=Dermacentor andersoni TaxID=34620 RepID=UPI0024167C48|nr:arylamine N-acetyltransferase-like [Dermacentor andersoni]
MTSPALFSPPENLDCGCQNGESFEHPDPELFAASTKRKIDLGGYRMGPLSSKELLLYLDVLKLQSSALRVKDLVTLNTLIEAHVDRIPFQDIDVFVGHQSPLDDDSVFRKVIEQRHGGICMELNNIFGRLLLTLGFKFNIRVARIRWRRPLDTPLTPLGHVLLCVDLGEEGEYFADVGFGGPNPFKALPVEGEAEPYLMRRLDEQGNIEVAIKSTGSGGTSASWRPLYHVFPRPQKWIDIISMQWYITLHPRSLLRHVLMVGRFVNNSWLTLVDGRFCRRSTIGQVEQRHITDVEEVLRLFDNEFALKLNPDMDLDLLRSRIKSVI